MYYTMLVIVPKFCGHEAKSFIGLFNFRFLIKSSIRYILIVKVQKVIKLDRQSQFGHRDARFWTQIPHLNPKPTFESQISNFQLLILILSPK